MVEDVIVVIWNCDSDGERRVLRRLSKVVAGIGPLRRRWVRGKYSHV